MAADKDTGPEVVDSPIDETHDVNDYIREPGARPSGWMYRQHKIGKYAIPWYAHPKTQLTMVAFVCFLCPGMFNALSGLGGGGKAASDTQLADNMVSLDFLFSYFPIFPNPTISPPRFPPSLPQLFNSPTPAEPLI